MDRSPPAHDDDLSAGRAAAGAASQGRTHRPGHPGVERGPCGTAVGGLVMADSQVMAAPDDVVFDVAHVTLRFGGVVSLNDVSMQLRRGEILAVIGPNGAGKTSLFNSLTGVYTPQEGSIILTGHTGDAPVSVLGLPTHKVNRLGVARTFQN